MTRVNIAAVRLMGTQRTPAVCVYLTANNFLDIQSLYLYTIVQHAGMMGCHSKPTCKIKQHNSYSQAIYGEVSSNLSPA